jgi:methionyl-tRNA formyltransferase
MKIDEGLDTGDILTQEKIKIKEHEKTNELLERLSKLGAKLLAKTAYEWIEGKITPLPQDNSQATLCQLIDREDGHIQWTQTTQEIYNRYRALFPWPGIFSYWEETQNQLIRIKLRAIYPFSGELTQEQKKMLPGTVFVGHDQLCIKTFDTAIIVESVQPECKAVMPVYDFLNGHKTFEGAVLK